MPVSYQYRCPSCRRLFATLTRADATICPDCSGPAVRKFSFNIQGGIREHWNQAVGEYVSNSRQMSDALKRKGDEMSARLGMDHSYEMVDPADMADSSAHGVTIDEGVEHSRRVNHDARQALS